MRICIGTLISMILLGLTSCNSGGTRSVFPPPPTAPRIESVSPARVTGGPGDPVTFAVSLSGDPATSIAWDFGEGATPRFAFGLSVGVNLAHRGTHRASVRACNDGGCSDLAELTFEVTAPSLSAWTQVAPPAMDFSRLWDLSVVGERLWLVSTEIAGLTLHSTPVSSFGPTPSWERIILDSTKHNSTTPFQLLEVDGLLVLVWSHDVSTTSGNSFELRVSVANDLSPTDAADFGTTHRRYGNQLSYPHPFEAAVRDGVDLAIMSCADPGYASERLLFLHPSAGVTQPLAQWDESSIESPGPFRVARMTWAGGRYQICYLSSGYRQNLNILAATVETPALPEQWITYTLAQGAREPTILECAGRPLVACALYDSSEPTFPQGLAVYQGAVPVPTNVGEWTLSRAYVPSTGYLNRPRLRVVGGRPVVTAIADADGIPGFDTSVVARALDFGTLDDSSWQTELTTEGCVAYPVLGDLSGRVLFAFSQAAGAAPNDSWCLLDSYQMSVANSGW